MWPIGLVVLLFIVVGRLGFQPTDDGNLLAQTYRLLHGQAPHRDVIFARPMGSAFLHVLDFGVPLPLFEAARLIGIAEIVAYSLLFAWLILEASSANWRLAAALAAAASALVNMHTFPLIGWYTTDGILLVASGFVALSTGERNERTYLRWIGLLLLGAAPLAKQSFFLAPVLGLAFVLWEDRSLDAGRRIRRVAAAAALLATPAAAYGAMLVARGALRDFVDQVAGATTVWGGSFARAFGNGAARGRLFLLLGAVAAAFLTVWLVERARRRGRGASTGFALLDLAIRMALSGAVVWFIASSHLAYRATWGLALIWAALLVVLLRAAVERTLDRAGVLVVAVGWMTSLSWGYEVPNLVAGTAAFYLLARAWRGARIPDLDARRRRALYAAGLVTALAASAIVGATFMQARYRHPYGDRPAAELTAMLANVSPDFGRIRTNRNTASYLSRLASCVRSHPARWTAVLPDNPGIYPALRLRNPFPIDWMYYAETTGHEERIVQSARRLDGDGHYLVLFETFRLTALQETAPLPLATISTPIYGGRLMREIRGALHGTPFACGYFVGDYLP